MKPRLLNELEMDMYGAIIRAEYPNREHIFDELQGLDFKKPVWFNMWQSMKLPRWKLYKALSELERRGIVILTGIGIRLGD